MSTQRLKLDWTLNTAEARLDFLKDYLDSPKFQVSPLTSEESEMCSNYLLWGKKEDGRSVVQDKYVKIKTKNGTWDENEPESLDVLVESPSFNEADVVPLTQPPIRTKRFVFSRAEARAQAPSYLLPIFEELWRRIDWIDLLVNYYDLAHGRRKTPPRDSLLQNFSEQESEEIKESATHLNQYQYLKKRHELVELRNLQYTYRDFYSNQIQRHENFRENPVAEIFTIGVEVPVRPLGLRDKSDLAQLLFKTHFEPKTYTQKDLERISNFLWEEKPSLLELDFEDEEHVQSLFETYFELKGAVSNVESTTKSILDTLRFYIRKAELNEVQLKILELKMNGWKNQRIADFVNKEFGKSYSANYISTIFHQKIIKSVAAAASVHLEEIQNLFFPENWKKCNTCGYYLLINEANFVKKSRSKDGYANRCKKCDRLKRQLKKEK